MQIELARPIPERQFPKASKPEGVLVQVTRKDGSDAQSLAKRGEALSLSLLKKDTKGTAVFDSSLEMSSVKTSNEVAIDGGTNAVCDYTDGGGAPAVELFDWLDTRSLRTGIGEQAMHSDKDDICRILVGEDPTCSSGMAQARNGGNATEIFGLQVNALQTAENNMQLATEPQMQLLSAVCSVGSCSLTCDGDGSGI